MVPRCAQDGLPDLRQDPSSRAAVEGAAATVITVGVCAFGAAASSGLGGDATAAVVVGTGEDTAGGVVVRVGGDSAAAVVVGVEGVTTTVIAVDIRYRTFME